MGTRAIVLRDDFDELIRALAADGRRVVGPVEADGAIVHAEIAGAADLPAGRGDVQEGGRYRLTRREDGALFGYTVAAQGWKRQLFPPRRRLWRGERRDGGFAVVATGEEAPPLALLGVRACELAAIQVQDKVFSAGGDLDYLARRQAALIVAVACGQSGATCFCASMGTGPAVGPGFDLLLTELTEDGRHAFLVEVGTPAGAEVLAKVAHGPAAPADTAAAQRAVDKAAAEQRRAMPPNAARALSAALDSGHWQRVAERCLSCGNCTLVCPTCFCTTVEDSTTLDGAAAERWRRWDSCFSLDHSYIHGGHVRRQGAARYRQWITHKLSFWFDQFGTSGCTGCGRCITWCPVGIDITEEARAVSAGAGEG